MNWLYRTDNTARWQDNAFMWEQQKARMVCISRSNQWRQIGLRMNNNGNCASRLVSLILTGRRTAEYGIGVGNRTHGELTCLFIIIKLISMHQRQML